ncbi:5-methylcytosine-specific restriction endonuclease system specificity protein McrC [Microbacterium sp. RU33B]|uniref:5-methylcytosine-specific restriction endonuclease system specificity protein McrC n=1 Tax=Microbacterium sp. RU33B TaxID=1907390 RepID=UPI00095FC036|nr:5-methylcytosine-specific restriction endonuclease system specificity protein McrC [Microbacterium sp. RU33B]SIT72429.1 5-methylcytosine-specific restriction enzyme subunit McrC [Microbacterium sp. RU33B]
MTDRSIAIRNVYVMLAYAFRGMHSDGTDRIAAERFDHLQDLLAEILVRGVGKQVKRGLHRDYLERSDALATVRGRIDITRTIATRSMTKGRLACEFDEYEPDTPHNQALKSVIVLLLRRGEIASQRKDALRRLLPYMDAVTLVSPSSVRWNTLHYHRANADYRLLLGVCELVVKGLLPTHDSGAAKLTSWVSDDAMSSLYERFLRQYFRVHHPELSPAASGIAWDYDQENSLGAEQLPAMRTDVTLRDGHRKLIIDAKYYSQSMQTGAWGKTSIHSANLYQLLAYVKNADVAGDGEVSGMLLYARTDAVEQPDLDIVLQGNRIIARTLNLNQPWKLLRTQLEYIAAW